MLVESGSKLYIALKYTGIHFLCWYTDGLKVTFFGKGRKGPKGLAYVTVESAKKWYDDEQQLVQKDSTPYKRYVKISGQLQVILDKYARGEIKFSCQDKA